MNINRKLWLATGTAIAVITVIALAIGWAASEVTDASRQRRQSTEIVQRYTQLRVVSFDYLRSRSERASAQWYAVSARIDKLIADSHSLEPEHAAILAALRARRATAPQLFAELGALRDGDFANTAMREHFEAQLVTRLLIGQQDSLIDAFRLTELAYTRIEVAQRREMTIALAGLALLALVFGSLSWLVRRHLLMPIIRLQSAAQEVAAGNLNLDLGQPANDEIGDLERNFDTMTQTLRETFGALELNNHELLAANQELEAFSYSVSHDLRAPLRSIDGFARVLIEDHADQLDADGRDALARVLGASQRMGQLIEDLLQLSQVTRAEIDVMRTDLSAMARAVTAEIDGQASGRVVEWAIEPNLHIEADPTLLRIALQNLLHNAWKFTARTAQPVIRVGAEQRGGKTEYYVADNGAGFDMAYADRLFGAFQRLHRAEDFGGGGIGLAIVKRIIRRHGGELRAEAKVGEGACFHFTVNKPSLMEPKNEQCE